MDGVYAGEGKGKGVRSDGGFVEAGGEGRRWNEVCLPGRRLPVLHVDLDIGAQVVLGQRGLWHPSQKV